MSITMFKLNKSTQKLVLLHPLTYTTLTSGVILCSYFIEAGARRDFHLANNLEVSTESLPSPKGGSQSGCHDHISLATPRPRKSPSTFVRILSFCTRLTADVEDEYSERAITAVSEAAGGSLRPQVSRASNVMVGASVHNRIDASILCGCITQKLCFATKVSLWSSKTYVESSSDRITCNGLML